MHGNNSCGVIPSTVIPKLLEVTFIKKAVLANSGSTRESRNYPIPGLDYPNDRKLEDYSLRFDV